MASGCGKEERAYFLGEHHDHLASAGAVSPEPRHDGAGVAFDGTAAPTRWITVWPDCLSFDLPNPHRLLGPLISAGLRVWSGKCRLTAAPDIAAATASASTRAPLVD